MVRLKTVLVVDDADGVRELVRAILLPEGYEVLEARDGLSALCLAEAFDGPIDLVVTDVEMPSMSGPEMVRRLSQGRRVGVLYMSGLHEEDLERHGLRRGMQPLLAKPFDPRDLVRMAAYLMSGFAGLACPEKALAGQVSNN